MIPGRLNSPEKKKNYVWNSSITYNVLIKNCSASEGLLTFDVDGALAWFKFW